MKDTGIVRRIDELGRIVIPKEIRRTLRLHEGTHMEIYTNDQGELVLKKYSIISDLKAYANTFVNSINETLQKNVLICNMDEVVSCAGFSKKEYLAKPISVEVENKLMSRKSYILNKNEINSLTIPLILSDKQEYVSQLIVPIIINSDVVGAIILASVEDDAIFSINEVKVIQTATSLLTGVLE